MDNSFDTRRLTSVLFIGILAVLFALQWGPGAKGCGDSTPVVASEDVAATVNGKQIPLKEFIRTYSMQLQQFRSQGGLPPGLAKQLGVHTQVMDQLVNTELLAQAAEARGIRASDQEMLKLIWENTDFHKDGKFDRERYREVLRDFYRRTDVEFEEDMRRRLSALKMLEMVEQGAVVSEDEVKARYLKDANKAQATFVRFLPTMFVPKVPAAKPGEVDAWTKAHDAEIAAHYQANQFTYHQPERAKVRQILIRVGKDDPEAKKTEAKQKIDNLRKELDSGKDFAELAKNFSEDTETRDKGGDLGLVERYGMAPPLADAVFKGKPGDVVGPVESALGWHLGKVEEIKPPETKPLDAVKGEIAAQLFAREKAREVAKAEAEKALAAAKAGKALTELFPASKAEGEGAFAQFAKELKPEAVDTGEFNGGAAAIPQLGVLPEAQKAIFAAEQPALLEQLFASGDGFAVVAVTKREKPSDGAFAEQQQQIRLETTKAKQFELRESFIKSLRKTGQVVINESALDKVVEG